MIGRILDLDGQSRGDVDIEIYYGDGKGRRLVLERGKLIRIEKDGRFRIEGVIPGLSFGATISDRRTYLVVSQPRLPRSWQVKSGQTLDLGDLRVKPAP